MSWIKRNLYFVIGGAVAVLLLGLAGFYFYARWTQNNEIQVKLDEAYTDWERIAGLTPNPGNEKVDNIKLARQYQREVQAVIQGVQKHFVPIPPVPNPADGVVTKQDFNSSLRRTIDQLQHDAAQGGVTLPPKYDFSFQAEKNLPNFAAGSLPPLAAQLGDIKTICTILFQAKVNSLDSIRRERVSADDQNGPATDYLDLGHTATTNDLAVLVPYEVTFQSFSTEVAGALSSFGSDEHGIIVKSVNVEPAGGVGPTDPNALGATALPGYAPGYNPEAMALRGMMPGRQPVVAAPVPTRGGLQTVLDEKPLKVTLVLNVVRLLPKN
ncbi:MAG TPA: Amuc_1100 family pilus-like protein [Candidatus Paceibacterota bacterium]|nr:Amuc_1100 family pilus-like protein [Candidatus Paceibacterota bacterium]